MITMSLTNEYKQTVCVSMQYSMIMVTTIQQVLRPFFVMNFIMGLGSYPMKQSTSRIPWITCLSILYSMIIWFSYAYLYYYAVTSFTLEILYPAKIFLIAVLFDIFTTIISVIMSFYHQEKLRICMKRLAAVDDTLEQLGTPKAYRKMHMYLKRIVIGWIVFSFISNCYDTQLYLSTKRVAWVLLLPYILKYCTLINIFVDLLFTFFLWYIGTRFDKVNEHMRYLFMNEKHMSKWKKSVVILHRYVIYTNNYKRILWILMHLHLELCRIARELNLMFGTQLTFKMASYITNITIMCFAFNILLIQYGGIISLYYWINLSCWILIFIMRIYLINYICECVRVKAKKIDKIFHQLTNNIRYADLYQEIYQFTLQAIRHPLEFTGMGLFYFGNGFLRKLCTTILMYVIIMIQMKISLV